MAIALNPGFLYIILFTFIHCVLMVTLNVYESVSDWVDFVWVFGDLGLFIGFFMGFGGWIYECEGIARCFKGFWGISGDFFRDLRCGLSR